MSTKLTLADQLRAIDTKDRTFYDRLTEEERKKFSPYLMFKYSGSVEGIPELEHYYLMAQNQRVNKHFFALSRHPKLQWLLCTTVSPGMGVHRHYFMKSAKDTKTKSLLSLIYPDLDDQEIDVLEAIMPQQDIINLVKQHGIDDKQISVST
jgi:hypothetical protein